MQNDGISVTAMSFFHCITFCIKMEKHQTVHRIMFRNLSAIIAPLGLQRPMSPSKIRGGAQRAGALTSSDYPDRH